MEHYHTQLSEMEEIKEVLEIKCEEAYRDYWDQWFATINVVILIEEKWSPKWTNSDYRSLIWTKLMANELTYAI